MINAKRSGARPSGLACTKSVGSGCASPTRMLCVTMRKARPNPKCMTFLLDMVDVGRHCEWSPDLRKALALAGDFPLPYLLKVGPCVGLAHH